MGKSVGPHDGLVLLNQDPRNTRYQPARPVYLLGADVRVNVHVVLPGPDGHDRLLQGCVTGPFPDPVDGTLHLAGTRLNGGQGVRNSQSQVVVTVNGQDSLTHIWDPVPDGGDEVPELIGYGVSHRVRDVDGLRTGLYNSLYDFAKVFHVASRRVFRRKLHAVSVPRSVTHGIDGSLSHLVVGLLEFEFDVDVRSCDEGVDPRLFSLLQRLPCPVNILFAGPAKTGHRGLLHRPGYGPHRLEVTFRGNGESRLDDINVHTLQVFCHLELFLQIHGSSRRLLTVP